MPNLNPHLANDRLVLHTVHTDEGATELYFGRASDDMELDWEGSVLFHHEGGFTYKLWNDNEVPLVVHVQGARVRVSVSEDQPPTYGEDDGTIFDSDEVTYPSPGGGEIARLRAEIPEWKLPDVPDDATLDDLQEILAEIDADDPPLLT